MELQLKSDRSRSRAAKQFCQSHKIKTVDRVAAHLQSCGISTTFSHHATITLNPRCSCRHGSSHPVTTRSCQPLPRSPGRLFDSSTRTRKAQSSGLHRAKSNNLPFSGKSTDPANQEMQHQQPEFPEPFVMSSLQSDLLLLRCLRKDEVATACRRQAWHLDLLSSVLSCKKTSRDMGPGVGAISTAPSACPVPADFISSLLGSCLHMQYTSGW